MDVSQKNILNIENMSHLLSQTLLTGCGAASAFLTSKLFVQSGYEFVDQGVYAMCAAVGAYLATLQSMKLRT